MEIPNTLLQPLCLTSYCKETPMVVCTIICPLRRHYICICHLHRNIQRIRKKIILESYVLMPVSIFLFSIFRFQKGCSVSTPARGENYPHIEKNLADGYIFSVFHADVLQNILHRNIYNSFYLYGKDPNERRIRNCK